MLKNRLIYAFMVIVNGVIFIFTNTRPLIIIEGVLLILPLISYAALLISVAVIHISCSIDKRTVTDKEIFLTFGLGGGANVYPKTVSFRRSVHSIMFDKDDTMTVCDELSGKHRTLKLPFKSSMCGKHLFKVDNVRLYDSLCLFSHSVKFTYEQYITVYPQSVDMSVLRRTVSAIESEGIVYDRFKKGNDRTEIFDLREYERGDDRRSVHWKLSAKLNKTVVREYSRPNNYKTLILCDLTLNMNGKEIPYGIISHNIALLSALSGALIRNGTQHSICMLGENVACVREITMVDDIIRETESILSVPLSKKEFNSAMYFINMNIAPDVSRLVFITHRCDMSTMQLIAGKTDITIITTNNEGINTREMAGNVEIISVDEGGLYTVPHHIAV